MHILALDVGTTSVKSAVLDVTSADPVGGIARAHHEVYHPTADAAELDADELWRAVGEAAREAVAHAGGVAVEGVGLSCLTPTLVLLGDGDRPLGRFWTHLDHRARPVARRAEAEVGAEFLATTGNRPLPGGISATCCRQRCDDEPGLRGQVRRYLDLHGWLGLRLTGRPAFDPAGASFTGLFNTVTDQRWSPRWCEYFGVDPAWLPEVLDGADTLGGLRPEVAADWGVPAGVPVKLGTADTSSALLAAGARPGDVLHSVGTTQVLAALVDRPVPDPRRLTRRLGVGPAFVHVTHNPVGGVALDWLYKLCFADQDERAFFEKTLPSAHDRQTTVALAPPFLGGDRLQIDARSAALTGLTVTTDRLDVLAAVLEAMRRGHRSALAALGLDAPPRRIFLTGGGADAVRSALPEYATADVRPIEEGSLRGVARLFG